MSIWWDRSRGCVFICSFKFQ